MTKKKSIFDSISEDLHNKREERKKRKKDEHNSFYYELYRDWGKYKDGDDDFRDNLRSVLKYWIKNELKSEDEINCRTSVISYWKQIGEKEYSMGYDEKYYEREEQELQSMYGSLKFWLRFFDLNGEFSQKYWNSEMIKKKKSKKERIEELKKENERNKIWDEYTEEEIKVYNGPTIVSKGSRDLLDILKKILSNVSIEEEHLLLDFRFYRLDFYFDLDERKIGVEYQGKQHSEKVDYFGGEEHFKKQKKWDKDKREICEYLGIELVYFYYNEKITESLIRKKLNYNKI